MNILKYLLIILLCLSGQNFSYAGTVDPSTPDSKYVEYAKDFHYVFLICGTGSDGKMFCGSAVAIDKHHILTAAHVVESYQTCYMMINEKKYNISEVIVHKTFETNQFGIGDIAIGYCEDDFGLSFYPSLYEDENEIGEICSIAGYGLTGNFLTGAIKSDGNRRAGSNLVDRIEKDMLICTPSRKGDKGYTSLEFLIASGDSGGGLFIDGKLAGINSCIISSDRSSPNSRYNEESGHTRISKFAGWIHENKRKMDKTSHRK